MRTLGIVLATAILAVSCARPGSPSASVEPGATGSPSASVEPGATGSPSASAEPGAAAASGPATRPTDELGVTIGSVVVTVSDRLRVRSAPGIADDSLRLEPLLPLGTELVVLGGPVEASGYRWYDVVPLTDARLPSGWIAGAARSGQPWITPATFDCPPPPTDMRALVALPRGVGFVCFAGLPITVEARVVPCNCDVDGAWYTPGWFSSSSPTLLVEPWETTVPTDVRDWFVLLLDPGGEHPRPVPLGEIVEVTGLFDHPAASSCTVTEPEGEPVATQRCRLEFAVVRIRPLAPLPAATDATLGPLPGYETYVVQAGDTMSAIARRHGVTLDALLHVNPHVTDPDRFAVGDVLAIPMPVPVVTTGGSEVYSVADGTMFRRFLLPISNWAFYDEVLFEPAPDLEPCGRNAAASRLWVDIYDAGGGRLYGFCALRVPVDLTSLWFAVPLGSTPPGSVYVVLRDRRSGQVEQSAVVAIPSP